MRTITLNKSEAVYAPALVESYYTRSDRPGLYAWNLGEARTAVGVGKIVQTKDPDWKVLAMKRADASGYYFNRRIKVVPLSTTMSCRYYWPGPGAWFDCSGSMTWSSDLTYPTMLVQEQDDDALRDLALARLKRKLSSRSNQMNTLVPLVELRQFRGLITSLTFLTTDLFHALLKIKKSKGKSAAQFAAHAWLTYSFAANPTLSDIKQLASTIHDVLNKSGGEAFTDYGVAKKQWKSRSPTWQHSSLYGCNSDITVIGNHKLSYRYVAGYNTPLRSANNYNAMQDFGLEIGSLVPALWELTAFSWLADYFGTFGDYLEDTFTSEPNKTFYVNLTKRYTMEGQWDIGPPKNGMPKLTTQSSREGSKFIWDLTERTALSSLPTRALRLKTADEIGKNAMNKLLNLGSILVGGRALSNKF